MSDFGETFKTLTISQLNFIDTHFVSKMGLKEPERTCKRATVEAQLWPFRVPKVSVLYNSLIINTYKIENRKWVTIWLLLKFPELPRFAIVSNNSCYLCKDK